MERSTSLKSVFVLAIIGFCMSTNGFAGLVSSDSTELIGNLADPSKPGCFKIQVDYDIYDGTAGTDPLGSNGLYQAVFKLTHLGSDGSGEDVVNLNMFSVYSTDSTSASAVNQGGTPTPVAPSWIDHVGDFFTDQSVWWFDEYEGGPGILAKDDVSQLLILTFNAADIPQENIIIEADSHVYGIYGQETITLAVVPEPATMILLAGGTVLLRRRRR